MSTKIPASHRDLLDAPFVVVLATTMGDGQPQVTPVWCNRNGDQVWVNSAKGRQKDKNIRARSKVTVTVFDPKSPQKWMEIRGSVVEIVEGADAEKHINDLSLAYQGQPFSLQPGQQRCIYKIEPSKINTS